MQSVYYESIPGHIRVISNNFAPGIGKSSVTPYTPSVEDKSKRLRQNQLQMKPIEVYFMHNFLGVMQREEAAKKYNINMNTLIAALRRGSTTRTGYRFKTPTKEKPL